MAKVQKLAWKEHGDRMAKSLASVPCLFSLMPLPVVGRIACVLCTPWSFAGNVHGRWRNSSMME
jgi:hypothetical protein